MQLKEIEGAIKGLLSLWANEKRKEKLNKVRYSGIDFGPEEYEAMMNAVFNGWWSNGKFTIDTEKKLAAISERNHALLFNSGSTANLALMLAARQLYFKPGDKILTLSCGFPTTVNPIIHSGLTPVFADIALDTLSLPANINLDRIQGIFIAHTLGFCGNIDKLLDEARNRGIVVMYDACDAYGSKYKGRPVTSYGRAASLSFYAAHHISCGEGGAVVTNDTELYLVMRGIRNWGRYCASMECCTRSVDPESFCPDVKYTKNSKVPSDYGANYQFEWIGYNFKVLESQAAILGVQIDRLDEYTALRRRNYEYLYGELRHCARTWDLPEEVSPFSFPMILPGSRRLFADHMKRAGIETRMIFGGNLLRHPAYSEGYESIGDMPNSDLLMEQGIMLGCSHVVSEEGLGRIVSAAKGFYS